MKKFTILLMFIAGVFLMLPQTLQAACISRPASGCPGPPNTKTRDCKELADDPAKANFCCDEYSECCKGTQGLPTAIGCIPTDEINEFVAKILRLSISLGGGIAFLLMLWGAFRVMTSSGDPKSVQAGQELITSALAGLILIIFSVFLLQLIGVKILQLPGFG